METVVEIRPPLFKEIQREPGFQSTIWVVKRLFCGTLVSRSVPAIARQLSLRQGSTVWPTAVYRPNPKHTVSYRCKDTEEVNNALAGVDQATFIIFDPKRWIIEGDNQETNASTDLGKCDA